MFDVYDKKTEPFPYPSVIIFPGVLLLSFTFLLNLQTSYFYP